MSEYTVIVEKNGEVYSELEGLSKSEAIDEADTEIELNGETEVYIKWNDSEGREGYLTRLQPKGIVTVFEKQKWELRA